MSELDFNELDTDDDENGQATILAMQANAAALARIQSQIGTGPSLSHCESCGEEIEERRQRAVPGCKVCIYCKEESERLARRR